MENQKRYLTYKEWIKECRSNPIFEGADWSRIDLFDNFYSGLIAYGPSPELRRSKEKELAKMLGARGK